MAPIPAPRDVVIFHERAPQIACAWTREALSPPRAVKRDEIDVVLEGSSLKKLRAICRPQWPWDVCEAPGTKVLEQVAPALRDEGEERPSVQPPLIGVVSRIEQCFDEV